MKLVVTGSTGFIGGEVLAQALTHPDVDAVISLTRREVSDDKLPSQYSAQLRQLVLENNDEWKSYPQHVRDEIRDADGWVWALGSFSFKNDEALQRVSVDYTVAALDTILNERQPSEQPVRFAYLSGALTERDRQKGVWFKSEWLENAVVRYGQQNPEQLSTCVARPMQVLSTSSPLSSFFQWSGFAIGVDQLAAWLVNAALKGQDTERPIVENKELQNGGSELLRPSSVQKQDSKTPA
ncbi:MAG: hypothetical protein Q9159_003438 [Coniocarpon cinnabarinum]